MYGWFVLRRRRWQQQQPRRQWWLAAQCTQYRFFTADRRVARSRKLFSLVIFFYFECARPQFCVNKIIIESQVESLLFFILFYIFVLWKTIFNLRRSAFGHQLKDFWKIYDVNGEQGGFKWINLNLFNAKIIFKFKWKCHLSAHWRRCVQYGSF